MAVAHADLIDLLEDPFPALICLWICLWGVEIGGEQVSLLKCGGEADAVELDPDEADGGATPLHRAAQCQSGPDDGRVEGGGRGQHDAATIAAVITMSNLERNPSRFQASLTQVPGGSFCQIFDHRIESARAGDVLVEGGPTLDRSWNLATTEGPMIFASAALVQGLTVSTEESGESRAREFAQLFDLLDAEIREDLYGTRTHPG